MTPTPLYELPDSHRPTLLELLQPHLPLSLIVLDSILDPSHLSVFTSFPPESLTRNNKPVEPPSPWLIIVNLGVQVRVFSSFENDTKNLEDRSVKEEAEELFVGCMRTLISRLGVETLKLGGINELWREVVRREFQPRHIDDANEIWLAPEALPVLRPLPTGLRIDKVSESSIADILATATAPHSAEYFTSRIPFSTALLSPSNDLVAYCFTHLDGSIGSLAVAPSHRRQGLGRLVMQYRQVEDKERRTYSYVGRTNESSKAVMRSLGWECRWSVLWVIVAP